MRYPYHVGIVLALVLVASAESYASSIAARMIAEFDPQTIANAMFLGRAIERILIVVICGVAVVLGFVLFRIVLRDASSMEVKGETFRFSATRIGPGVFFCLFGVVGLVYCLGSQPQFAIKEPGEAAPATATGATVGHRELLVTGVAGVSDKPIDVKRTRIRALNTAIKRLNKVEVEAKGAPEKNLSHALSILRSWRDDLISDAVGPTAYGAYLLIEQKRKTGAVELEKDAEARKIFDAVDQLKNDSITLD